MNKLNKITENNNYSLGGGERYTSSLHDFDNNTRILMTTDDMPDLTLDNRINEILAEKNINNAIDTLKSHYSNPDDQTIKSFLAYEDIPKNWMQDEDELKQLKSWKEKYKTNNPTNEEPPFYNKAKQHLSDIVKNKIILIDINKNQEKLEQKVNIKDTKTNKETILYNPSLYNNTSNNKQDTLEDKTDISKTNENTKSKKDITKEYEPSTNNKKHEKNKQDYKQQNTLEDKTQKPTEFKYGIMGDFHGPKTHIKELITAMLNKNVDAFVLNGDLGDDKYKMEEVIESVAKTGKQTYVQPGGHEQVIDYFDTIDKITSKYDNIQDVIGLKNRLIKKDDHNLLFIPGSSSISNGQFAQTNTTDEGIYFNMGEHWQKITRKQLRVIRESGLTRMLRYVSNFENIENDIKDADPKKTIVFNHDPQKFNNDNNVDHAHFLEYWAPTLENNQINISSTGNIIPGTEIDKIKNNMSIIKYDDYKNNEELLSKEINKLIESDIYQFCVENKKNSGNHLLSQLYNKLGLHNIISNHIHESSHHAHDYQGNNIAPDTATDNLYYNPGAATLKKAGIISPKNGKISYQNISL